LNSLPNNSGSLLERHDSILENFSSTLQSHCGDDRKVPISSLYSQFPDCGSFEDVVSLSTKIAPSAFDMAKALKAHAADPLYLDSDLIAYHTQHVSTLGLGVVLQQASTAILPITLQPDIAVRDYSHVSTFQALHRMATDGVTTSLHPSFIPNNGNNCPQFDDSISDPRLRVIKALDLLLFLYLWPNLLQLWKVGLSTVLLFLLLQNGRMLFSLMNVIFARGATDRGIIINLALL
jgi:hypothetical protein